jgi:hypothetical protein
VRAGSISYRVFPPLQIYSTASIEGMAMVTAQVRAGFISYKVNSSLSNLFYCIYRRYGHGDSTG